MLEYQMHDLICRPTGSVDLELIPEPGGHPPIVLILVMYTGGNWTIDVPDNVTLHKIHIVSH